MTVAQGPATATNPEDRGDGRDLSVPSTDDTPTESPKQMMNRLQHDTGMKLRVAYPPEVGISSGYADATARTTSLDLTRPSVYGYRYDIADDVRVALVVEKSTVNDVLVPLCNRLDIDFLPANGYVTHTRIHDWLHRDVDRPARLLFLSDFDPAGAKMPQAFARELEFLIRRDRLDVDFAVDQIGLTRDQVIEYELPRVPLNTKDDVDPRVRGKRLKFLDAHDIDGAVELDALVARHPGELQRIITEAVDGLRDDTYRTRVRETRFAAEVLLQDVWSRYADEIDELVDTVRQQLDDANAAHVDAVERIRQGVAMTRLLARMNDVRADLADIGIPEHPVPIRTDREQTWMMRSDRDYLAQLDAYRRGGGA